MSFTAVRVAIGRALIVFGVLVLLFIPYVLWGTGILAAGHQQALRQQFATDLRRQAAVHPAAPPGTTPDTVPGGAPAVAPPAMDPPIGTAVGIITIPKISISMAVVEGTDTAQLEQGPGHYPTTPLPGEAGNVAIAGHRTTYLHPFYNLNELSPGDPIVIRTVQGTFTYRVTTSRAVSPYDVAVVDPTPTPTLTLTTCNPRYSASQRLVVHADLTESVLARPPVATPPTTPPAAAARAPSRATTAGLAGGAGAWLPALLWGLVLLATATAVWLLARRLRGVARAGAYAAGGLATLVVLFFFFGAVTPLLPASY